jgi:hypothetical protein
MHWIIQRINGESDDDLIAAASCAGHKVTVWARGDFGEVEELPPGPALFHGSIESALEIQDKRKDITVWLDAEKFSCSSYFSAIGDIMFNTPNEYMVAELIEWKWDIYRDYAKDSKIFIRPDSGLKTFTGQLLDLQDFDAFWTNKALCTAKMTDWVYVASPQEIQGEWRFVVDPDKRDIVAQSTYMYQGNRTCIPSAPNEASALCRMALSMGLNLGPLFVLDIAQAKDGHFGILEANAFSTSGLYACKMDKIVARATQIFETQTK